MPRSHAASKARAARKYQRRNLIWLWVGLGVLAVLIAGIWILGPKSAPAANGGPTAAPVTQLTAAEAYQKYQEGAFFLDVRTQAEWEEFHLKDSTLIPLGELQDRLGELPTDREIVVVCRTGHRSLSAVSLLQKAGFSQLASLSGGLQAWVEADYPVEK